MKRLNKFFVVLAAVIALGWVGANTASAGCTAIAPNGPGLVRSEGSSELIGAIRVECDSTITAVTGSFIQVTINGAAASPVAGNNTDTFTLTGAVIGVAPTGVTASVTTTSSCSGGVTLASSDTDNFPCPTIAPNIAFTFPLPLAVAGVTTSVSGSTITFSNITPTVPAAVFPVPAATNNGNLVIAIRNIRVNIAGSALPVGSILSATIGFGGGFAVGGAGSPPQIVNIATVVGGIVRTVAGTGFSRGVGAADSLSTSDILSCAPNRRTPTGVPATATSVGILGSGLTFANERNSNALFATGGVGSAAGLWRTSAGEDAQAGIATPTALAGSGAWSATNLPASAPINLVPSITIPARNGTRFVVTITNVPTGINVYVLRSINTIATSPNFTTALLSASNTAGLRVTRVTGPEADGSGGAPGADVKDQFDLVPTVGGTVTIVYELAELAGVAVATGAATALKIPIVWTGIPPTGIANIDATLGLAPVGPPTAGVARPQFAAAPVARRIARTLACVSWLLFPWIAYTADGAFDTGLAIANTSIDPLSGPGTTPAVAHAGDVTLSFWRSGGGTNPAPVTIAKDLPGGQTAVYVVSSLKDAFTGYIIASCKFAFGHGFAFINSPQPGSGGAFAQGYLALSLPSSRDVAPEITGQ